MLETEEAPIPHRSLIAVATAVALTSLFVSLAGAAVERQSHATAQASVVNQSIVVRGKPFFPVMLIDQCTASEAAHARRLGANLIVNESCPGRSARGQLANLNGRALGVLSMAQRAVRGSALAGFTFPDEPEGNGWSPERLRRAHPYVRGSKDGLLSFLTTGAGFYPASYTRGKLPQAEYGRYARLADVAGFDLYPLGHCSNDLSIVYEAQRAFQHLAGRMPTFQWIETGPIKPTYCGGFKMAPAELQAEVWLAVAGGARGIGYFTHTWSPKHKSFDVSPTLQHEMAKIDNLLGAVRPALVGRTILSGVDTTSVKVLARRGGDMNYVIAVNAARLPINVKMNVPALRNGVVRVFGERRAVTALNGHMSDSFAPLAVHVYVQSRSR